MSLASLATQSATTKRPTMSGSNRTPVAHLSGLACTPLYPADPNRRATLLQELKLDTLHGLWECFVLGNQDIKAGDFFAVGGKEYLVRGSAPWTHDQNQHFTNVTVEEQHG